MIIRLPVFLKKDFRKILIVAFLAMIAGQLDAQVMAFKDFEKTFKWRNSDIPKMALQTSTGDFVLAGRTHDAYKESVKRWGNDFLVIKLSSQGKELVKRNFGGDNSDDLVTIAETADGGFILAGNSLSEQSGDKNDPSKGGYDFWLVKTDAGGNKLWDRSIGGSGSELLSGFHLTADGGFLLGGISNSGIGGDRSTPNNGYNDFWVISLDANGNKRWDQSFGKDFSGKAPYSLYVTPDGGLILTDIILQPGTGSNYDISLLKLDMAGNKVWENTYGGPKYDYLTSLLQTKDGGFLLTADSYSGKGGDKTTSFKGDNDIWLLKLDASGNKLWDSSLASREKDYSRSVEQTLDGGFIVLGYSYKSRKGKKVWISGRCGTKRQEQREIHSGRGFWAAKLDSDGEKEWDKTFGFKNVWLASLHPTADQGYIMAGNLKDKGNKSRNVNLIKLNNKGQTSWEMKTCNKEYQVAYDMQVTVNGSIVIEGWQGIAGGEFQTDYYLVKLSQDTGKMAVEVGKKKAL